MQEVKVVAVTREVKTSEELSNYTREAVTFSGKAAGVCYMPDSYLEDGIQNEEKAYSRALGNIKSGHHSVFDHVHLSLVLNTNKMIAMILNSLGVYATSEKSARYTKMKPETDLELQLYEKWKDKLTHMILLKYPGIDDEVLTKEWLKKYPDGAGYIIRGGRRIEVEPVLKAKEDKEALYWREEQKKKIESNLPSRKLAQENARYMISVYTPTTMMYTVSYRQLCLVYNYFKNLLLNLNNASDEFSHTLHKHVDEFLTALESIDGIDFVVNDNKNQYIRFLEAQHVGERNKVTKLFENYKDLGQRLQGKESSVGDSYTLVYEGSLAMLAQAQRHRTLRYSMKLSTAGEFGFYTPEIVKDAGLEEEWQKDIKSVAYCVPQGTMVRITEQGLFEDFALKCKERLCGRAQLEVMKATVDSVNKFITNKHKLSYDNRKLLESMTINNSGKAEPCARCAFKDFKCQEGCSWKANKALTRLI